MQEEDRSGNICNKITKLMNRHDYRILLVLFDTFYTFFMIKYANCDFNVRIYSFIYHTKVSGLLSTTFKSARSQQKSESIIYNFSYLEY